MQFECLSEFLPDEPGRDNPGEHADEEPFDPDMAFTNDMPDQEPDAEYLAEVQLPDIDSLPPNPMYAMEQTEDDSTEGKVERGCTAPDRIKLQPIKLARENDLAVSRRRVAAYIGREKESLTLGGMQAWGTIGSRLEGRDDSFDEWFGCVLPSGESIKDDIETTLAPLDTRLGLELGGDAAKLFEGFTNGFFDETAGITLVDCRYSQMHPTQVDKLSADDAARNHRVVEGDMLDDATKQKTDDWLGDRKLGLVIERMHAGILSLPDDPYTLAENANHWYERLAEGGLMFIQIPPGLEPFADEWKQLIDDSGCGLDVQLGQYDKHRLARIHKLPGAPESLSLISARTLMKRRWDSRKGEQGAIDKNDSGD
jgi:hypothetical protein